MLRWQDPLWIALIQFYSSKYLKLFHTVFPNDIESSWTRLFREQSIFYRVEVEADFVDLPSLNVQTFADVHLSSCTKPHCLSCSHISEIFRFSSSTFKLLVNPVFYIVNVACTPESVCYLLIYFGWNMLMRTGLNHTNFQVRAAKTFTVIHKNHFGICSVQRCPPTGQKVLED